MKERAQRAIAECRRIAAMSEEPGRTTRRFLTPPVREVHALLRGRMESSGHDGPCRCGWQSARTCGSRRTRSGKRLMLGSHIDTVPDAGAFDGVLGVTLALEWAELAQELESAAAIEVIAFSEEEGVRFGVPFIGSRAVAGRFDPALLALKDADGVTLEAAIRAFGLDPGDRRSACSTTNALGFVEIHIEQGPVLEAGGLSVAAVTVDRRADAPELCTFIGHANHAGTTPMHLRRDALAGAAEWIGAVEALAQRTEGLVATVGNIDVEPNAGNVIPGAARVSLDVRHADDAARNQAVETLLAAGRSHCRAPRARPRMHAPDGSTRRADGRAADGISRRSNRGCRVARKRMPSGAGHDAMVMAARVPTAMLFLRSPGGISHHPDETVLRRRCRGRTCALARKFLERLAGEVR